MEEVWKPVKNYEGLYEVSNKGRVKSLDKWYPNALTGGKSIKKGIILSPWIRREYYCVGLGLNSKHKYVPVHRLVAEVFCEKQEHQQIVNHKDGNRLNNEALNLEWLTQKENVAHATYVLYKTGSHKTVLNTQTGIYYPSILDAYASFNYGKCLQYFSLAVRGIRLNTTSFILCG